MKLYTCYVRYKSTASTDYELLEFNDKIHFKNFSLTSWADCLLQKL